MTVAELRKRPGVCSGAAQAARCFEYPVHFPQDIESNSCEKVVVLVLFTYLVELKVLGLGRNVTGDRAISS